MMLEPIALPTERSALPDHAAIDETRSSGAEVPNPTIVSPMMSEETPRLRATAAAPSTNRSAAQTRMPNPATIAAMERSQGRVRVSVGAHYKTG